MDKKELSEYLRLIAINDVSRTAQMMVIMDELAYIRSSLTNQAIADLLDDYEERVNENIAFLMDKDSKDRA